MCMRSEVKWDEERRAKAEKQTWRFGFVRMSFSGFTFVCWDGRNQPQESGMGANCQSKFNFRMNFLVFGGGEGVVVVVAVGFWRESWPFRAQIIPQGTSG